MGAKRKEVLCPYCFEARIIYTTNKPIDGVISMRCKKCSCKDNGLRRKRFEHRFKRMILCPLCGISRLVKPSGKTKGVAFGVCRLCYHVGSAEGKVFYNRISKDQKLIGPREPPKVKSRTETTCPDCGERRMVYKSGEYKKLTSYRCHKCLFAQKSKMWADKYMDYRRLVCSKCGKVRISRAPLSEEVRAARLCRKCGTGNAGKKRRKYAMLGKRKLLCPYCGEARFVARQNRRNNGRVFVACKACFDEQNKSKLPKGAPRWPDINRQHKASSWRKKVLNRDGHRCQICNADGPRLEGHHIEPYKANEALRFSVDNGLTLCHRCHLKTVHMGRANNPPLCRAAIATLAAHYQTPIFSNECHFSARISDSWLDECCNSVRAQIGTLLNNG